MLAAVLALALLAGCATTSEGGGSGAASSPPAASPTAGPDPVQVCVRQVAYWVGETLRAALDQGFDYQHMGLSGATYEVVRSLVAESRERGGLDAATPVLVATRAEEECRALHGPAPSGSADRGAGGWP